MTDVVVVHRRASGIDAIDQYARRLTLELARHGVASRYEAGGLEPLAGAAAGTRILLQYNPFRWGRSGFAPMLPLQLARLRRAGASVDVMVHEAWIDITGPKSAAIGGWQRLQLQALLRGADRVMASTESVTRLLGPRTVHLAPASNVEPVSCTHRTARAKLDLDGAFVVTLFGRGHPSRALDYAAAAVDEVARDRRVVVLNLGAGAPPLPAELRIEERTPGPLSEEQLSLYLRASDLVLLPFRDGMTTRRSTLMAALAHGRPVLGLAGPRTDAILLGSPDALRLTPLGDRDAYARAAAALADSADDREAIGASGRALYEAHFDWPVLTGRLLELCRLQPAPARTLEVA
jgi:glycosyltransferase involved in cell wall biosynthesis